MLYYAGKIAVQTMFKQLTFLGFFFCGVEVILTTAWIFGWMQLSCLLIKPICQFLSIFVLIR